MPESAPVTSEDQLIHEFQKDPHEKVCLTRKDYKGKPYFDLRVWFQDKEKPMGFFPSKRGICLSTDLLPQVKAAFEKLS